MKTDRGGKSSTWAIKVGSPGACVCCPAGSAANMKQIRAALPSFARAGNTAARTNTKFGRKTGVTGGVGRQKTANQGWEGPSAAHGAAWSRQPRAHTPSKAGEEGRRRALWEGRGATGARLLHVFSQKGAKGLPRARSACWRARQHALRARGSPFAPFCEKTCSSLAPVAPRPSQSARRLPSSPALDGVCARGCLLQAAPCAALGPSHPWLAVFCRPTPPVTPVLRPNFVFVRAAVFPARAKLGSAARICFMFAAEPAGQHTQAPGLPTLIAQVDDFPPRSVFMSIPGQPCFDPCRCACPGFHAGKELLMAPA